MSVHNRIAATSLFAGRLTRLQHRMADLATMAAFTLCPLSSWSTELSVRRDETDNNSSSNSSNHKSLTIAQWTALGSGGFVWDGARRLAEHLNKHGSSAGQCVRLPTNNNSQRRSWAGLNVIELGAGTGALGLAIAALGANVTLTDQAAFVYPYSGRGGDRETEELKSRSLLDLMRFNVQQNAHHFNNICTTLQHSDSKNHQQEHVQVREMLWGNDSSMLAALPHVTYDVIVAADVLLFQSAQAALLTTLRQLSTSKTVIFIEHTDRSGSNGDVFPKDLLDFLTLLKADTHVPWYPKIVKDHGRHITLCIERGNINSNTAVLSS